MLLGACHRIDSNWSYLSATTERARQRWRSSLYRITCVHRMACCMQGHHRARGRAQGHLEGAQPHGAAQPVPQHAARALWHAPARAQPRRRACGARGRRPPVPLPPSCSARSRWRGQQCRCSRGTPTAWNRGTRQSGCSRCRARHGEATHREPGAAARAAASGRGAAASCAPRIASRSAQ